MDANTLNLLLSAAAGPASGVVVALLCMVMFGYFLIKYILPSQERHLDRVIDESSKNRDLFEKESSENRKVFQSAVQVMSDRLDNVEDDVKEIKVIVSRI